MLFDRTLHDFCCFSSGAFERHVNASKCNAEIQQNCGDPIKIQDISSKSPVELKKFCLEN